MDGARVSFTKREFCRRNSISPAYYYVLRSQGRGPREMDIGRISAEAERDWQREREAAAEQAKSSIQEAEND